MSEEEIKELARISQRISEIYDMQGDSISDAEISWRDINPVNARYTEKAKIYYTKDNKWQVL